MPAVGHTHWIRTAILTAAPLVAILVVLAPYLWPLDHGPTSPRNDIRTFQAPNVQFIASALRDDGELPRWNPQDFAGIPLVGDPQAGIYNPVNWLLALRPTLNSFGWLIIASVCAGALGFMRLAQKLGCSITGAAVGATAFALGGKLLLHLVELGHVVMAPFFLLPWVLLLLERCARRASAARVVSAALVLALMVVWMHPQLLVYTGSFVAAWALLAAWRSPAPGRALASLGAVAVWAAALGAVHLLPIGSLVGEFARAMPELQNPAPPVPPLAWRDLITGSAPSVESRYTFGGVTLLLGFAGFIGSLQPGRTQTVAWFQVAAALGIALYGVGALPDTLMAQEIFRHPARALVVLAAPAALLVALGVDTLLDAGAGRRRLVLGLAAGATAACLMAADASQSDFVTLGFAIACAVVLAESQAAKPPARERLALPAALLLIAVLGFDAGSRVMPSVRTAPEAEIGRRPPGLQLPPDLGPDSRVAEPQRDLVLRGIPELDKKQLGLESLTGYNSLIPWRFLVYTSFASGFDPQSSYHVAVTTVPVRPVRLRLFDLLGVTHFLYPPRRPDGPWIWVRTPTALPRAYLVPRFRVAEEGNGRERLPAELRALEQLDQLDPRKQVLLHGKAAQEALAAAGVDAMQTLAPFRAIPVGERRPHRIALAFENTQPAVLVLNEPFFPGWRAWDNGSELPVLRANGMFRALVLTAGRHQIELEFSPLSWRVGRAISLAALAASAALLLWQLRKLPQRPPGRSQA